MRLWPRTFPRLYDLFLASDQSHPVNYFLHPRVEDGLNSNDEKLLEWERKFSKLTPDAWSQFKSKATPYVTVLDSFGFPKQLFEVFNEVEGYLYLKKEGCKEITFIEEKGEGLTPDMYGISQDVMYLVEVKTIGESDDWIKYLLSPAETKNMVKGKPSLDKGVKNKIQESINKAIEQLDSYSRGGEEKVVFLVTIFDQDCLSDDFFDDFKNFLDQVRAMKKKEDFRICYLDKTPFRKKPTTN